MINENEAPEGYKAVRPLNDNHACQGCSFKAEFDKTGYCTGKNCVFIERFDKCEVIFIKKDAENGQ